MGALIFFIIVIALHFTCLVKKWEIMKSVSKALIIPSLFALFLSVASSLSLVISNWHFITAALFFYTLGDVFLEFRAKEIFFAGVLSFAFGHVAYMIYFLLSGFSFPLFVLYLGICYLLHKALFESFVIDKREKDWIKYTVYISFVSSLAVAAGSASWNGIWIARIIALLGCISYAFSDSLVIYRMRKVDNSISNEVLIMMSYIAANALLLSSILLKSPAA